MLWKDVEMMENVKNKKRIHNNLFLNVRVRLFCTKNAVWCTLYDERSTKYTCKKQWQDNGTRKSERRKQKIILFKIFVWPKFTTMYVCTFQLGAKYTHTQSLFFFFCLSFSLLLFLKFHPYHHSPFKTNFRYFTLLISISRSRPGILDLNPHMGKKVRVRFQGGREVVGVLRGFDPMVNIVIDDSIEYLRSDGDEYKANVRQI